MKDFLDRHSVIARGLIVWVMALVTYLVVIAGQHVTDMSASFAAFAGGIIGMPASIITFLQWSRSRSE